jgi:hypothetical protein
MSNPNKRSNNLDPSARSQLDATSYTGVDIKVIAHLPWPKDILEAKLEELAKENDEIISIAGGWGNNTKGLEGRLTKAQNAELKSIQEQITRIHKAIELPGTVEIGSLQTITFSIFREKFPIRTLGRTYTRGYTRGSRTIAGSMIFTMLWAHALHELTNLRLALYNTGTSDNGESFIPEPVAVIMDQLPPMDFTLIAANELGDMSQMRLYGVEFVTEGTTMSIHDLLTETVSQYVAQDIEPWQSYVHRTDKRRDSPYLPRTPRNNLEDAKGVLARLRRYNPFI